MREGNHRRDEPVPMLRTGAELHIVRRRGGVCLRPTPSPRRFELSDRVEWRDVEGRLDRLNGPAVEWWNGETEWFRHGVAHRTDGPAREADGTREWLQNGCLHRADGPAIEWQDGSTEWWLNGRRHRPDGPALEEVSGVKQWWLNGRLHRLDGPAIEYPNGGDEWWIDGTQQQWPPPLLDDEWASDPERDDA